MSMSPHQIFGRLQELKRWQHTHEKLLKRSSFDEKDSQNTPGRPTDVVRVDPDQIRCSPGLNFEDLLEEKLSEFDDVNQQRDVRVPKKPYLRKGTGLRKYNLNPDEYKELIGNKYSNGIIPSKKTPKLIANTLKPAKKERPQTSCGEKSSNFPKKCQPIRPRTSGGEYSRGVNKKPQSNQRERKALHSHHERKKTEIIFEKERDDKIDTIGDALNKEDQIIADSLKLKDFMNSISKQPVQFTPLKVPEMRIQPKGNWCDVSERTSKTNSYDNFQFDDSIIDRKVVVQSQWKNGSLKGGKQVNFSEMVNSELKDGNYKELDRVQSGARKNLSYENSDLSLYEKALETELMIFEALERRTEQSGFCSTNTSIIQLLASTPSKFNFKDAAVGGDSPVFHKIIDVNEEIERQPVKDVNDHFQQVNQTDIHSIAPSPQLQFATEVDDRENHNLNGYVSEKNDSEKDLNIRRSVSVNTEEIGIFRSRYSSESSDISEDSSIDSKVQYNSRPSSNPRQIQELNNSESCSHCGNLIKNKLQECQRELDNLVTEKNRIVQIREKLTQEKLEFEKEVRRRRREMEEMQLEFEEERKKVSDKFEKPQKDFKSKMQQKKEREELNNLKIELNETKELMKLRETKNAMCIARLRNQVKLLEKNNSELKADNEKLLKEKSKLAAQQRTHNKATETKMLREISKNISKLTEETFKNQHFKTDTSSEDDSRRKLVKDAEITKRKSNESFQGLNRSTKSDFTKQQEEMLEENPGQNRRIGGSNIEETYKSLFGGQDVIIEENVPANRRISGDITGYTGLGKTERILEDGTREIKYTNGNMKLILENGTVRYYYASNDTWHTNFPDGTEVIEFPNGQSEKKFKDGKCLIFFPDGLIQTIFPDGSEEVKYPDGSKLHTKKDGDRFLFLSNGQVEIHTKDQKRREYPDGTVKILYPDGSQETRYSNGRVRMKDSKGEVVLDTESSIE